MLRRPPSPTLFPYTSSSDLEAYARLLKLRAEGTVISAKAFLFHAARNLALNHVRHRAQDCGRRGDRKSTRLNSSHGYTSYAVLRLKKNTFGAGRLHRLTLAC